MGGVCRRVAWEGCAGWERGRGVQEGSVGGVCRRVAWEGCAGG